MPASGVIDNVDEQIIEILRKDSRTPYTEISDIVRLTEGTIRGRVDKLVRDGVIKRFTIDVSLGKRIAAIIFISTEPMTSASSISEMIKSEKGVDAVYEITGDHDIAVFFSAFTLGDLKSRVEGIKKLEGVHDTNTTVILQEFK